MTAPLFFDLKPTHNPHRWYLPLTPAVCVGPRDNLFMFGGVGMASAIVALERTCGRRVIWATALCVNLRFVIFSAGWRRYFGALPRAQRVRMSYFAADLNYVLFMRRFPEPPPMAQALLLPVAARQPRLAQ